MKLLNFRQYRGFVLSFCVIIFLTINTAFAESSVPEQQGFVTDYANTLSESEEENIRTELARYEQETSNEIVVLVVNSTEGEDIAEKALQTFRTWKIGKKDKDNGVLMLIAVKDRKLWITTGYGLEGALPDLLVKSIIDSEITPEFKKGQYAQGIMKGIDAIEKAIGGEYTPVTSTPIMMPLWVFFVFFGIWISLFCYGAFSMVQMMTKNRAKMKRWQSFEDGLTVKELKEATSALKSGQQTHPYLSSEGSIKHFEEQLALKKASEACAPPTGITGVIAALTVVAASEETEKNAVRKSTLFFLPIAIFTALVLWQCISFFFPYSILYGIAIAAIEIYYVRLFAAKKWRDRMNPKTQEWIRKAKQWKALHPASATWGRENSSSSGTSFSSSSSSSSGGGSSGGGGAGGSW